MILGNIIVIISILVVPMLSRNPIYLPLVVWISVYLGYRMATYNVWSPFVGTNFYITVAELVALVITIFLAYNLANHLNRLEETIEKLVIPSLHTQILTLQEADEKLNIEFHRSQRFNHPISIIVVEPSVEKAKELVIQPTNKIENEMSNYFLAASMARVIVQVVRDIDIVVKLDYNTGRYAIVCPETDIEGIKLFQTRIREAIEEKLNIPTAQGTATFPNDALTFEHTMQKAEQALYHAKIST